MSTHACLWQLISLFLIGFGCECCRNLMARQDLKELGFKEEQQQAAGRRSKPDSNADKQKQGFIAGVRQ